MKTQLIKRAKRQGYVLLLTLVSTGLVGFLVLVYLNLSRFQNNTTMRSQAWNVAIPVVEAGLEHALMQLRVHGATNIACDGWTQSGNLYYVLCPMGDNYYFTTISNYAGGAASSAPVIESRAFVRLPIDPAHEKLCGLPRHELGVFPGHHGQRAAPAQPAYPGLHRARRLPRQSPVVPRLQLQQSQSHQPVRRYPVARRGNYRPPQPRVRSVTHFTYVEVARVWLGLLGFIMMVLLGSLYYIMPRLLGFDWPSAKCVRWHFWCSAAGIGLIVMALTAGGLIQGVQMNLGTTDFITLGKVTVPFVGISTLGLLLVLAGQCFFAANFFALARRYAEPFQKAVLAGFRRNGERPGRRRP